MEKSLKQNASSLRSHKKVKSEQGIPGFFWEGGSALFKKQGQKLLLGLALIMIGLGLVGVKAVFDQWSYLQVNQVVLTGNLHEADPELIKKTVVGGRVMNLVNLPMDSLIEEVKQLPWVRNVEIRRLWPNSLEVNVVEQVPVARWGDDQLLNNSGEVFDGDTENQLPWFEGAQRDASQMLMEYERFTDAVRPLQLSITHLKLSDRQAWTMELSNGLTVILGRTHPDALLRQWVMAYPQVIIGPVQKGERVDLRYANGLALYKE
jgi:cell division protein FtsQ